MISALLDCIDEIGRLVCNIGKAQRVLLAVLQGRESGVNIDNVEIPTVDQLTQQFFENPEIRGIKKREELLEKACEFCQALPKGSQEPFLKKIKDCIEQLEQDWEAAAAAEAAHA
ncbi:MAG: hypothetical protein FJZ64_05050 [Chlamydiae bacterium]|nr:hypothetical protein [Chlamydiota bacterium]